MPTLSTFVPAALPLAIIVFILTMSQVKQFTSQNKYYASPNQELFALAVMNLVSSCFSAFVPASSLARSVLANKMKPRSQLWALVSVAVIAVCIGGLAPLLRDLPSCVLAAIIIAAFKTMLLQITEPLRLWRVSRGEAFVWVAVFLVSLLANTQWAIIVALALSVGSLIKDVSRPTYSFLGRLGDSKLYRDTNRYPAARSPPEVLIFRFDGNLHFANHEYFADILNAGIDKKLASQEEELVDWEINDDGMDDVLLEVIKHSNITTKTTSTKPETELTRNNTTGNNPDHGKNIVSIHMNPSQSPSDLGTATITEPTGVIVRVGDQSEATLLSPIAASALGDVVAGRDKTKAHNDGQNDDDRSAVELGILSNRGNDDKAKNKPEETEPSGVSGNGNGGNNQGEDRRANGDVVVDGMPGSEDESDDEGGLTLRVLVENATVPEASQSVSYRGRGRGMGTGGAGQGRIQVPARQGIRVEGIEEVGEEEKEEEEEKVQTSQDGKESHWKVGLNEESSQRGNMCNLPYDSSCSSPSPLPWSTSGDISSHTSLLSPSRLTREMRVRWRKALPTELKLAVVIHSVGINGLDSSSLETLKQISQRQDILLLFVGLKAPQRAMLAKHSGIEGVDCAMFHDLHDAVIFGKACVRYMRTLRMTEGREKSENDKEHVEAGENKADMPSKISTGNTQLHENKGVKVKTDELASPVWSPVEVTPREGGDEHTRLAPQSTLSEDS